MNPALKSSTLQTTDEFAGEIAASTQGATSVTAALDDRIEANFLAALERPPRERDAFLAGVCAEDEELHIRVRRLLAAYERSGGLLEGSPDVQHEFAPLWPENAGDYIGAYRLVRQIGEGGFGVIWLAEQERPVKRHVAVKIVKVGMDTREVVARFEQEKQALALMDHPNIARVLDGGMTPSGRPCFVMDLVDGIKITEFCDRERLSVDERLRLFIAVCHAVQHAHQKGIIHRDLKPSNILVMRQDGAPVPKVIDFGVAKALQQRLTDRTFHTEAEQIIGTPLYMSPEQADSTGLDVDTRSDIYSLGVLLYELLAGATPFATIEKNQKNIEAVRRFLREQDPLRPAAAFHNLTPQRREEVAARRSVDPRRLSRKLGGDLGWITMKALEKDRELRYDTAAALAADLKRHLAHEPVLARPHSGLYRIRRFARRHKIGVLAGGAVALVLILGLAVSLTLLDSLRRTLAKLTATAPAFAAAARELNVNGELEPAIEKLDVAIELQSGNLEYWLQRAALRRALERLQDAAADYRHVLAISPGDKRAMEGLELCERLLTNPREADGSLSRESLPRAFPWRRNQKIACCESSAIGREVRSKGRTRASDVGGTFEIAPNASNRPFKERLKIEDSGETQPRPIEYRCE
jgi:serine/threonine protein kinase